jgi:rubredoxin
VTEAKTWMCLICGWIYDEAAGAPDHGIAPGTPWEQVPMNWTCPECGARKEDFEMVQILRAASLLHLRTTMPPRQLRMRSSVK